MKLVLVLGAAALLGGCGTLRDIYGATLEPIVDWVASPEGQATTQDVAAAAGASALKPIAMAVGAVAAVIAALKVTKKKGGA